MKTEWSLPQFVVAMIRYLLRLNRSLVAGVVAAAAGVVAAVEGDPRRSSPETNVAHAA